MTACVVGLRWLALVVGPLVAAGVLVVGVVVYGTADR